MVKPLLSALAITITFWAFVPYIRAILSRRTVPHVFSWIIWGITTLVVFFAQWQADGGAGAVAIGVSAMITLFIAALAFQRRSDLSITRLDWCFLIAALAALPLWHFSGTALLAVVILTLVDVLGFGPTLRKAWQKPYEESVVFFGLFLLRNLLVIAALEAYSLTTWLFPAAIAAACLAVIVVLITRRRSAQSHAAKH